MGCDIHGPYIEQVQYFVAPKGGACEPSEPGAMPIWGLVAMMDWDRDYDLFGVVANVRAWPPEGRDPKGYPFRFAGTPPPEFGLISLELEKHIWPYRDDGSRDLRDCHDPTWFTAKEMVGVVRDYARVMERRGYLPQPGPMIALSIMQMAEWTKPDYPTRIVMCFDS